jgi:hypothetical protein
MALQRRVGTPVPASGMSWEGLGVAHLSIINARREIAASIRSWRIPGAALL